MPNYIALAIPLFLVLIGVEVWAARRRRVGVYRFADAVVDLACGMTQQTVLVFFAAGLAAAYAWTHAHFRLVDLSAATPWPWLVAFVVVDLSYYWWHRLSHEVNFLWAVHVVHHQSEDYNLAVALRQAVASTVTILPFHLPIALLGVPTVVFLTVESFSTLYQFWIHTELVGKLGPLEKVVNTPSLHRVHHATNPRYLDKNYGATLVVWDRLFGTWEEEREKPVYGITKPLRSFDPLWAQVHYWIELWRLSRATPRLADKLRVWVAHPAWRPPGVAEPAHVAPAPLPAAAKYAPRVSRGLAAYLATNLVLAVAGTFALLLWQGALAPGARVALAALILLTVAGFGALLERRRWALGLEAARLALAAAAALVWLPGSLPAELVALLALAAAGMLGWAWRVRREAAPSAAHLA